MLAIALALALTQFPQHRLFKQPNLPTASYAFFEAFPASGAGTTTACSTTAPTGARGEALTFTRTGSATCTKTASGGLATTGIADGDLVTLAGNVARVEYDSAGTLGLLVESSRTNVFLQSGDISNAVNTNVGAPTLTGSQTDPFGTTTAVQVEDNDGAAYEGRQQTVTVTAATAYIMSCYIKAGTSTLARLSLDGTACNVSGLSTTTWTRASCADASSSGAAIVAQVLVGNATSDTGTVIYGGCQVEAGTYMTSYQPATAAAAARNAERAAFVGTYPAGAQSIASTRTGPTFAETQVWALTANNAAIGYGLGHYRTAAAYNSLITGNVPILAYGPTLTGVDRVWMAADGTNIYGNFAGATATTVSAVTPSSVTALCVGNDCVNGGNTGHANGVISRICLDPSPTRCR